MTVDPRPLLREVPAVTPEVLMPKSAPEPAPQLPELDLREWLRVLWRRRWLMSGTVVLAMALAVLALSQITPRYTARAQLMVDSRQANVLDMEQVMSGLPATAETIQSEIEVISSRQLAARVIDQLQLVAHPEFSTGGSGWRNWLQPEPANHETAIQREQITEGFLRRLEVRVAGRSRVINVDFTAADPALAAQAANALAERYLTEQLEAKQAATRQANAWLSQRLDELQRQSEIAEQEVARFRSAPVEANPQAAAARLRTLEREAQASRALYETVLVRYKETSEQQGLQQPDARLISRAEVPLRPSFPQTGLFLLMALAAGTGLALLLAFAAEKMDSGYRSSDQIEAQLGLPTIAMIPALRSLGIRGMAPEQYVTAKPTSSLAEAVRMLRTSLLLANVDQPPKVLLLTSALPGEGKTTVALALARLASFSGEKVVVVDADLRRPRVHTALGVDNKQGLVELLAGRAPIEQVLQASDVEGKSVHYITAGQATPHATELVRSQQMRRFIRSLAANYSLVIIDSPPVLPVADARVLATLADKTICIVQWSVTPREVVRQAVHQLRLGGVSMAGIVLNGVDVRRHAEYSYGDSGYYYGRYRKYYAD